MAFNPEDHIIKISGKEYLPVAARIAWFRSTHPEGQISTDLVQIEPFPVVKAVIANNDGAIIATAYGSAQLKERSVYAGREIEKAETAAIGRALASAGFGTLFAADDFDDAKDEHLADSPVAKPKAQPKSTPQKPAPQKQTAPPAPADSGTPWFEDAEKIQKLEEILGDKLEYIELALSVNRSAFPSGSALAAAWREHQASQSGVRF